jgi:hypothetical protein
MSEVAAYIGQRLSLKSQTCTVRYVGQVADKQGQWLGVEWDDASRGKHDGTHGGVSYFKCRLICLILLAVSIILPWQTLILTCRQKQIAHSSLFSTPKTKLGRITHFPPGAQRKIHIAGRSQQHRDSLHLWQICRRSRLGEAGQKTGTIAGHPHSGARSHVHPLPPRRRRGRSLCRRSMRQYHNTGSWWQSLRDLG